MRFLSVGFFMCLWNLCVCVYMVSMLYTAFSVDATLHFKSVNKFCSVVRGCLDDAVVVVCGGYTTGFTLCSVESPHRTDYGRRTVNVRDVWRTQSGGANVVYNVVRCTNAPRTRHDH